MGKAPIAKAGPNKVALTSYYGKVFFQRSELSKHDWSKWIRTNVNAMSLDGKDNRVTNLVRDNIPRHPMKVPRGISALSETVKSFKSKEYEFFLDHREYEQFFGKAVANNIGAGGKYPIGKKDNKIVYIDMNNIIYVGTESVGPFSKALGITKTPPTDVAVVKIFGKSLPVGVMLGIYMGWKKMVKWTGAKIKEYPANTRDREPEQNWVELTFKDKRIYVNKDNSVASMIFAGLAEKNDLLRDYKVSDLEVKSNFTPIILDMGLSPLIVKEVDIMKRYFIDPITKEALKNMKEPTKWYPLLARVMELLTTDEYPDETDPAYQRLRGYERISGMLYAEMVAAIRRLENSPSRGSNKLEVNKYTLWKGLTDDPATQLVQQINPLHTLKEQEAVTLGGTGGRSAQTLVMRSRAYHENDVGIISESTPDSAKVAIRTFATPNAKINSTLGFMGKYDKDKDNVTSLLSTTSNILPASDKDDQHLGRL